MLPMIEDELDVDSHSWAPSVRQAAGIPSIAAQAQLAAAAASAMVPASASSVPLGSSLHSSGSVLSAGCPAGSSMQPDLGAATLQQAAASAAAYAQERVRHMMAVLAPIHRSPQMAL